jgi:hypothetical protein
MEVTFMFNRLKNFLCTPEGILITGYVIGGALIGVMWADDKRESRRVSRAFEEGLNTGMKLSDRGIRRDDISLMNIGDGDIYSRIAILPKKAPNEPEKADHGAKTGDFCTISPDLASIEPTMVQNDDSIDKEE